MSLVKYPIFTGYRLDAPERLLIEAFLKREIPSVTIRDTVHLSDIARSTVFYPDLSDADLSALMEWKAPLLLFAGSAVRSHPTPHFERWSELGCGAVWLFPPADAPFFWPILPLPERKGEAFLISDHAPFGRTVRQLMSFAGFSLRIDFRSDAELTTALEEKIRTPELWPDLVFVDLDSTKIDILSFFHTLKQIFLQNHALRIRTRIVLLKDFSKPGLDIRNITAHLRFFGRRIFHPTEALFMLLESYYFHPIRLEGTLPGYRSIDELLHGPDPELPLPSPERFLDGESAAWHALRRASPFFWMQRHLLENLAQKGAVLHPEPDIDARNLFNGIDRP